MPERYPLRNADDDEAARLALLQALGDPITIGWFESLRVATGWHCAELGAGAGSMVEWLSDRVGASGSVTAVDRDTSQLQALGQRANVELLQADLRALQLPRSDYDLVHSRSVLMHLDDATAAVASAVSALRPGGMVFFEETAGAPAVAAARDGAPEPFKLVMAPIASRWTFAPELPGLLESMGMVDVRDDVRLIMLEGATNNGAFWQHTLRSIIAHVRGDSPSAGALSTEDIRSMIALLDDPEFSVPLSDRHRVTARRPA